MTQADVPLNPENSSVEQIAAELVEKLKTKGGHPNDQVAPLQSVPMRREPGIYFGLPAAAYHADQSLGSTDIRRLLQAPQVFWHHRWMNPARPTPPDSAAKLKGRALHALVLEGEKGFAEAFAVASPREEYPDALVTLDDLKAKLRTLWEPTSGTKERLAKRISLNMPVVLIFNDVLKIFAAVVERDKLEVIARDASSPRRRPS
jgi:hypothetical protein